MSSTTYRRLAAYGVAIAATVTALLLSLWLHPYLVRTIGAFFYIAVIVSTGYGGMRPGLVTIVLSTLSIAYFFIPPLDQLAVADPADFARLGIFALTALSINLLSNKLRLKQRKVEQLSQQLLQESGDRLQMALAAAQMGLWDWNIATREIVWSPEHERLFGFAPGTFDGRYETFDARLHSDDRDGLTQAVQSALQNRTIYQHEYRIVWAGGSVHWIEGRGQALYNEAGQAVRMSGTVINIDQRKQAEIALTRSEQQLRAIFEAEPECVKVITVDGIVQTINPAGLNIVEIDSVEQALGQCIVPLINPAYQQVFLEFNQQVANGKPGVLEFEGTGLKGTHRWLESHAVPLRPLGESTTYVLAVTRDISDRKRAEAELKRLNAALEQRVAERTAELSEANDRLQTELFQRERIERALQESELKFHAMFDQSRLFIGLLDPNGIIFEVNQRPHELTERMGETFVGRPFWELAIWGQEKQRQMEGVIERALTGEVVQLEMDIHAQDGSLMRMPDGSLVTHDIRVKAVKNAADQVMFLTVEGWDISDRKQAEEKLRTSEERFRSAFEDAAIGMALVSTDGRWLRVNRALCDIVGYSNQELLKTDFQTITHPNDLTIDLNYVHQLLNDEIQTYQMEKRYVHKHGHIVWVLLSVSVVRDEQNQPLYFISQIQNISDRKQAEASLSRLAGIVESSEDAIISKNVDGIVTSWNASAERLFGYKAAEVIGQSIQLIIPPEQQHEEDQILHKIRQGISVQSHETVRRRKDGTLINVSISISLVKDATGKIIGASKIARDITERRAIDQMKSEFISIVSHELRTPLTSMQAALSLLVEKIIDPTSEEGETIIQIASDGVDRLVRLVSDMLDLERLESGKIRLEKRLCNTARLIATAIDQMQEMANQAEIILDVTSNAFELNADPDRLLQVLINLLSNAIKFSETGSTVWLTVEQFSTPDSPLPTPHLLFTVKDQGRGIPAHKLESIFERFQQVDASDARKKGGTGLGLAICRSIVEQHDGRIWAESNLEQGSRFSFTIPIA